MAKSLYIAAVEARSGKSVVALGLMQLLSRRVRKVGFFRAVIASGDRPDKELHLILTRYNLAHAYEDAYAHTHEEARRMTAEGRSDELMKSIVGKYRELESRCDFVLCEGTDFTRVSSAFEFDFNARLANNLGSPVLAMVNGRRKSADQVTQAVRVARESFREQGCTLLTTIVNRVDPEQADTVRQRFREEGAREGPVYILPEEEMLGKPTIGEIATALGGRILQGDPDWLNREVHDFKIAAMQLPNFLHHVLDGSLIITPGDRADVILVSLATVFSETYPNISGLLLTGGLTPEPQVQRLMEGLSKSQVPVVSVDTDTYTTAMDVSKVPAVLTPDNDRKIATALGVFETHVDTKELGDLIAGAPSTWVTPIMFESDLIERARSDRQHIVLPEGGDERILKACEILTRRNVVDITLLGNEEEVRRQIDLLGLRLEGIPVVDPSRSESRKAFAELYLEMRKHKRIPMDVAWDAMGDVSYFGTMMVQQGIADGMVSGAAHTTQQTIRPAFEIIRTQPGRSIVSSVFLMCLEDRVLAYGDCAINPDPNPEQLADIAISSAETARQFGIEPRVAMLSYSTGESGKGEDVDKVREATRIARELRPDLMIEGPIQYDAAVDATVARTKMPDSAVAGRATVFIFPDLNTGNNTYKAVQRSAGAVAIGPVLQGLNKPVNDLSRGCTVTDIVNTVAITAIQAQSMKGAS
jgi:phosphate acetyltransferase